MMSFNPLSIKAVVLLTAAIGVIANPVLKDRAISCDVVRCASGTVCQVIDNVAQCVGGQKCGTAVCGAGLVCCNALCNICTKPGQFCIQGCPVTDPVVEASAGPVCGSKTCATGEAPTQQLQLQLAQFVVRTLAHRTRYAVMRAVANAPNLESPAPKKRAAQCAVQTPAHSAKYAATIAVAIAPSQAGFAPRNYALRRLRLAQPAVRMSAHLDRYAATVAAGSALLQAVNAPSNSAGLPLRMGRDVFKNGGRYESRGTKSKGRERVKRGKSTL
ncbi:hypothetical protein V499_00238 [Pseudogymnoascus sp. VKM F-103]|nr:hypothetical protein V499_00238 [Pseudogymnoascus sp. VKM F-103]